MRNNIFQEMSNKTSFKHTEKYHNSYLFSKSLSPKMSVVGTKSIRLMMMGRGLSVQEAITESIIASGNWQNFAFTTFE